ncbi:hypothetical protein C0989_006815 [Termitomyces sp. Mn162]|nr:hypothetical protein C0989_006815 [Termitomyces sp. Mn162]
MADKQIFHLLQQLHNARVPEDVGADILEYPIVQLAVAQFLNELNLVRTQKDEAHLDLFHSALGKEQGVAFPPQVPKAKRACTKSSVSVKGFSTQRAPLVPYNDQIPTGEDQLMDVHPDFGVSTATAVSSKPATAKAGFIEPAMSTNVADNPVVVATLVSLLANMPMGAEDGTIEIINEKHAHIIMWE